MAAESMVPRQLQLVGATGAIRTAAYNNRDHLVVPAVALMQGVIWPVNAQTPEFVPLSVLRQAPQGWNGRPCVGDHPARGRALISANEPAVLEAESFGQIFNTRIVDDRLVVEAWLDPEKAMRVGKAAVRVLERVRAGEPVEVSVGAFVTVEMVDGQYQGKAFKAKWTSLVPDHLALLPEGTRGACSVAMGCGMPRAAKAADGAPLVPRYAVTIQGLTEVAEERLAYDPNQPRAPAGSPEGGQWTDSGGGGAASGDAGSGGGGGETDRQRAVAEFHRLKGEWARINGELLPLLDRPDSPEAAQKLSELKALCKQMNRLNADPGGVEGVGYPGGARDLVIVGGGPGGMAAATMGGTDGLDTLLIEANADAGGQFRYSSRIENYPGYPIGVTGEQLAKSMHSQAVRTGADMEFGVRVTSLSYDPDTGLKTLTLSDGRTVTARAVILAAGVEIRKPTFPGAEGKGITVLDGAKLKTDGAGGTVIVAGGSNGAAQAALGAAQTANKVIILSRSSITKGMSDYQVQALRHNPKIQVIEGDEIASAALDNGRINAVLTKNGQRLPADALGVFFGGAPKTDWLPPEIARTQGKVNVNGDLETTMPGVFAVGDVRHGSIGRIGASVGDGQYAQRSVFQYFERAKANPNAFRLKKPKALAVALLGGLRAAALARRAAAKRDVAALDRMVDQAFASDEDQPYFLQTVEPYDDESELRDNYDPNQPRTPAGSPEGGQWTDGGAGGAGDPAKGDFVPPTKSGEYTQPTPIKTDNIDEAVRLISEGKVVELKDVTAVHTLLDKLAAIAVEAAAKKQEAPDYDLCRVTVKGTNLFCHDAVKTKTYPKGFKREVMPQFSGKPRPGSPADKLPRDKKGEVNASEAFRTYLKTVGLKVEETKVNASALRASQTQLVGEKVAGMMNNPKFDPAGEAIFVSSDNYVIDGHHRWAAAVGRDAADGRLGDVKMPVLRIDAPASEILFLAKRFTKQIGILPKAATASGTARAARARMVPTFIGAPSVAQMQPHGKLRAKLASVFASLRGHTTMPRTLTDADLQQALIETLSTAYPDTIGVAQIDRAASTVIYGRDNNPTDTGSEVAYFQSAFAVAEDGTVALDGTPEAMTATVTFAKAGGCGCHDSKEKDMHRNADRIQALLSHPKTPFEAADTPFLEGLSDERLAALEASVTTEPAKPETPAAPVAAAAAQTEDEFLAAHPAIAKIVSQYKAAEAAKRTSLLSGLKGKQDAYSDDELDAMPLETLEKVAKLAKVETESVDYAGVGAPRGAASQSVNEAPDPWAAGLAARKGA